MREKLCFTIFVIVVTLHRTASGQKFNLPDNLKPVNYVLVIYSDVHSSEPFYGGSVLITVHCDKETSVIILNSRKLVISDVEVSLKLTEDELQNLLPIAKHYNEETEEQYIIEMENNLQTGKDFIIQISFEKEFTPDFHGYKFEHYYGGLNGTVEKWMAVTKFGPGDARGVFPCFDQMNFKASFKIIHSHHASVMGFSNAPLSINPSDVNPPRNNWVKDEFEETELMSAFVMGIVLADFKSKMTIIPALNVIIRVWSDEVFYSKLEFAAKMARSIFMFYSGYFKAKYAVSKLDILALPKYRGDDDIKYGLITISDDVLQYPDERFEINSYDVVNELCHGICHQWIGAQVTMSQLNEYWLHEALVVFLDPLCIKEVLAEPKPYFFDSRNVNTFIDVLMRDTDMTSTPLLQSKFDSQFLTNSLALRKAYHLIRMVNFIIGPTTFNLSITNYLNSFTGKSSTLDDVWEIFTKGASDKNIDIKTVMESWIKKSGYPFIKVVRNYEHKILSITQEPFVMDRENQKNSSSEACWIVPVAIVSKNDLSSDDKVHHWLSCQELKISIESINEDDWVLLNRNLNVLSRTTYDERNWKSLQKTLLDQTEFTIINPVTRAHLMSDMLQLARAERLSYPIVFDTLKYLKNENQYIVWSVVADELVTISSNLFRTKLYDTFQKYVRDILTPVFAKKEFSKIETLPPARLIESFEKIIIDTACSFDVENCINQCTTFFDKVIKHLDSETYINLIPLGIRDAVLRQGVAHNDNDVWNMLFEKYSKLKKSAGTNDEILKALGSSTHCETLNKYLNLSITPGMVLKEDSLTIFGSLSFNPVGYPVMKAFLLERYKAIEKFHAGSKNVNLDSYFIKLLQTTTKREDLEELKEFKKLIQKHLVDSKKIDESINQVTSNLEWYQRNEATFSQFFMNSNSA